MTGRLGRTARRLAGRVACALGAHDRETWADTRGCRPGRVVFTVHRWCRRPGCGWSTRRLGVGTLHDGGTVRIEAAVRVPGAAT